MGGDIKSLERATRALRDKSVRNAHFCFRAGKEKKKQSLSATRGGPVKEWPPLQATGGEYPDSNVKPGTVMVGKCGTLWSEDGGGGLLFTGAGAARSWKMFPTG